MKKVLKVFTLVISNNQTNINKLDSDFSYFYGFIRSKTFFDQKRPLISLYRTKN